MFVFINFTYIIIIINCYGDPVTVTIPTTFVMYNFTVRCRMTFNFGCRQENNVY